MKKTFYFMLFLGLVSSCSEEQRKEEQTGQAPQELKEQIEVIEKSTNKIDAAIDSSVMKMRTT